MNIKTKSETQRLLNYYEEAGPDYGHWSKNFNMHFGYYEYGVNPFDREALLDNMNKRVFEELGSKGSPDTVLVDMGCGLGATLRSIRSLVPKLELKGVTIVPWQVAKARELNNLTAQSQTIQILEADYINTPLAQNSVDYVIAIESSCHAPGASKSTVLKEMHRILKPGGRFVIADGFRKTHRPLKGVLKSANQTLCDSWVIEQLGNIIEIEKCLKTLGFKQVKKKDISWNIAPSVAHVPGTVLTFSIKQLFSNDSSMNEQRWNNLKSPLLTMLVGLARKEFGYYLVSGTKAPLANIKQFLFA
ncbi:MAG: methyltransferase domain-containing protein [Bacteroidota bacterium]